MGHYPIELMADDNGTFLVISASFPEVTTFAESAEAAPLIAAKAIEEALAARMARDGDLPPWTTYKRLGSPVATLPTLTLLKASLYNSLKASGWTRAELARRLGWHREQVDRLFRLDHASRLEQIEAAFAAFGQQLELVPRSTSPASA